MNTPARTPNPILAALGGLLESALNRALALDTDTRTRVAALDGRALTVEFKGTPLALRLVVDGERLRVGPAFEGTSALRVAATPGALLAMALRRGDDHGTAPGKVEIAGDADLARRLEKLASGFRPDVEEAFARAFGDTLGVPIAQGFAKALAFARERGDALVQDAADFLRDESRDAVAPGEMEEFLDDVDALREREDRLEARVARLAARAEGRA